MREFYRDFYAAVERSRAHHLFCERVFGRDLAQHGFADMAQLDLLLAATGLDVSHSALDLGCGNGLITEYLSDRSGARIAGVDYIEDAVASARRRTAKSRKLTFVCADINRPPFAARCCDVVISTDSAYFADDLAATVAQWDRLLKPRGRLAVLYSHGSEPWVPAEQFPIDTLPPDRTPFAAALAEVGLAFRHWDLTQADYRLALARKQALAELEDLFESEGNRFIYDNRMGDAEGIARAIEEGLHARYLYVAGRGKL